MRRIGRSRDKLPVVARGERIYAIGDIHGRLDLFAVLIGKIKIDAARRPARKTRLVLIGDMIDRGPHASQVVEKVKEFSQKTDTLIVLRGNHELMMVRALRGDLDTLKAWLRFGGAETLQSWGVTAAELRQPLDAILTAALDKVPARTIAWLAGLRLSYRSGDFFFVHAGIRPGVGLNDQHADDLLWIDEDFVLDEGEHPAVIVHGHTICEHGPELLHNRIGLDTGAYRTGRLSAVGFEGSRQWSLSATIEARQAQSVSVD